MKPYVFFLVLGLAASALAFNFYTPPSQSRACVYEFHYQTGMIHDLNPLLQGEQIAAPKQDIQIEIRGALHRVFPSNSRRVYYQVNPTQLNFFNNGRSIAFENIDRFKHEISKPFWVEHSANGEIIRAAVDTSVSATAEATLKNIASFFQIVRPDATVSKWTAIEQEVGGEVVADYSFNSDSGVCDKRKRYYARDNSLYAGAASAVVFGASAHRFFFDTISGEIRHLRINEQKRLYLNEKPSGSSSSLFNADIMPVSASTREDLEELENIFRGTNYKYEMPLYNLCTQAKMKHNRLKAQLGSARVEDISNALTLMSTWNDSLYTRLVALLALHPEKASHFTTPLLSGDPTSLRFNFIVNALAETALPECQAVLGMIITLRGTEWPVMEAILPQVAIMNGPLPELAELLTSVAFASTDENIRRTAQLALGGAALHMHQSHPEKAKSLSKDVVNRMRSETDIHQKLLVLGNIGDTAALPDIKSILYSQQDSDLRLVALESLRFIPGAETDTIISGFRKHQDKLFRDKALQVIEFRQEERLIH